MRICMECIKQGTSAHNSIGKQTNIWFYLEMYKRNKGRGYTNIHNNETHQDCQNREAVHISYTSDNDLTSKKSECGYQ